MAILTGEPGRQKDRDQLGRDGRPDHPRTEAENVHVVVLDRLVRRIAVVADGGADTGELVRGDRVRSP